MKPKRIFLIRHAQSHGNFDKKVYETVPDWKIPLTEHGHKQARETGLILKNQYNLAPNSAVYVSPFKRTLETWEGIKEAFPHNAFTVKQDPRLREQEWGHLRIAEETHRIDKEREAYGHFFYRLPDGESGADVFDRVKGILATVYRDFKKPDFPDDAAFISHGYTLRIILMALFHYDVDYFHTLSNPPNCFIAELNLVNDRFKLMTKMKTE